MVGKTLQTPFGMAFCTAECDLCLWVMALTLHTLGLHHSTQEHLAFLPTLRAPTVPRLLQNTGPGGDGFGDAHPAGAPLLAAAATAFLNHMAGPGAIWQAKDLVWVVPDARCGSLPALETWAAAYQGQQVGAHGAGGDDACLSAGG